MVSIEDVRQSARQLEDAAQAHADVVAAWEAQRREQVSKPGDRCEGLDVPSEIILVLDVAREVKRWDDA